MRCAGLVVILMLLVMGSQMVWAGDQIMFDRFGEFLKYNVYFVDVEGSLNNSFTDAFGKDSFDITYTGSGRYAVSRQGRLFLYSFGGSEKQMTFGDVSEMIGGGDGGMILSNPANIMPAYNATGKKLLFLKTNVLSRPIVNGAIYYFTDLNGSAKCLRKAGYSNPVWLNDGCVLAVKVMKNKKADNHSEEDYSVPRLLNFVNNKDVVLSDENKLAKDRTMCVFSKKCSNQKMFFFKKIRSLGVNDYDWDAKYRIVLMNAGSLAFVKEFVGATDAAWCSDKLVVVCKSGQGDNVMICNKQGKLIERFYFEQCGGVHNEIYEIVAVVGDMIYIDDGDSHVYKFDVKKGLKGFVDLQGIIRGRS